MTRAVQVMLAATEQGWKSVAPTEAKAAAGDICTAHSVSTCNPNIVFETHVRAPPSVSAAHGLRGPLRTGHCSEARRHAAKV